MRASTGARQHSRLVAAPIILGPIIAFVIGASTSSIRDQVGASNVGIALAIVVALAALTGRGAGLTTAVTAALTFNFFHTKPYHSLRIHKPHDVAIVALLAVLGLVISDITAWRRRREAIAYRHDRAAEAPSTIGALVAETHSVAQVWPAVVNAILDQLSQADCHVEITQPTNVPLISRNAPRRSDGDDDLVLPAKGAAIAVQDGQTVVGYLVVVPKAGNTSLSIERRTIIAFADHLAIALNYGDRHYPPAMSPSLG
jgi:K+-sensing histidine kinase KdpD